MTKLAPRATAYPAIGRHGVVGDRRTAALVAADGTIDWMCLPDFDGQPAFASLLDAEHRGRWRFGPLVPSAGAQRYESGTAILQTVWSRDGELELTDFMARPGDDREEGAADTRVLVRRLRAHGGRWRCVHDWRVPDAFAEPGKLALFTTIAVVDGVAQFTLEAGDEAWAVLSWPRGGPWSPATLTRALDETRAWWSRWSERISYEGSRRETLLRSAVTMRLCCFEPSGSIVAAPTTSLPERIGGDRNYDYRFTWIRDASLAIDRFSRLGDTAAASRFLHWVASLGSSTSAPLQVCYGVRGETDLRQREPSGWAGYRRSQPVRFGNRAYHQKQIGSIGYLADAMTVYVDHGGPWRDELTHLAIRLADHTCDAWEQPDSGIWELSAHARYVSSTVMCWVVLDRVLRLAERLRFGHDDARRRWRQTCERIRNKVLVDGWSERMHAFGEVYGGDRLDAAALLIPIMGVLPADDPRVNATVERIVERLSLDGWIYRFDPSSTPKRSDFALGELEGAFIPCLAWLATTHALAGRIAEAARALDRIEAAAGSLGLLSEEFDPRDDAPLGNYPLVFSHAEYLRAILELDAARAR